MLRCGPETGQQKTPTPSSARTKGRTRSDMPLALRRRSSNTSARGLPRYHLEYAGTLPLRRAYFPDGRGMLIIRAESGHRYNGLSRTDLLARSSGFLQSLFSLGDLPRTGAGGTFSRVSHAHLTRSRSLCGTVCAYSSQRSGQHRLNVADTIANDAWVCQASDLCHIGASDRMVRRSRTAKIAYAMERANRKVIVSSKTADGVSIISRCPVSHRYKVTTPTTNARMPEGAQGSADSRGASCRRLLRSTVATTQHSSPP